MDNRITIKSITIRNFRSIRRETIKVENFSIFVGMNDAGKSNVLKALNLFFNNKVEDDIPYDYARDFTYLFPPKSKEAKAIKISVQFNIPETFSDGGLYTWEKIWKESDKPTDRITDKDGNSPGSRSRIPEALHRIKYRYVPAVKSTEYYRILLGELYASVAASLDLNFKSTMDSFSDALGQYTEAITTDVSNKLGLSSRLTIPTNLIQIFMALVFRTCRENTAINVPLTSRGDGIQARHIPIILKYIAEVDQGSRNRGSVKITTIWGFEEPENGLELSKAFELADEFVEYSRDIQIFLTTHSPAFYMTKEKDGTKVFYVEKKSLDSEETEIVPEKSGLTIAESMGLMPLVAPFIAEQAHKLEIAQDIYNKNFLTDVPTIMVEGETDVDYLKAAINQLSPALNLKINSGALRIIYKIDGAGTTQLCDWALSWIYSGFKSKILILLDNDDAGKKAYNSIVNSEAYHARQQSIHLKVLKIQPSDEICSILEKKIDFKYEIEHLFPVEVWNKWKSQNYASLRSDEEIRKMFGSLVPRTKTVNAVMNELVLDESIRDTILTYEPTKLKKKKMVTCLKSNFANDANAFNGFKRTLNKIEGFFND